MTANYPRAPAGLEVGDVLGRAPLPTAAREAGGRHRRLLNRPLPAEALCAHHLCFSADVPAAKALLRLDT